jgi:DMSO reductase family type II enzyme chaperone
MDRIEESLARTALWGALAEAFRRPGEERSELLDELPSAAAALGLDARELAAAPRGKGELAAAYDAVFGHVVRGPCPLYEGEYGEPRGHRFAHEIGDVTGFYNAFGLGPSRGHPERPDHIAVECEFMAFLALKEACAAEAHASAEKADLCRDASRKFLEGHLGRFGRALAARMRRRATEPFFAAAARLLDAAIVNDASRLGAAAGPEDLPLREDAGTTDDACMRCGALPETPR